MAKLVRDDAVLPIVRAMASEVVAGAARSNPVSVCEAIRAWCAGAVRFVHDPVGLELVHSPEALIRLYAKQGFIAGDCDDAAVLAAGLGRAVGCAARFVAVSFLDSPLVYRHVWAEIAPPTGPVEWIECDVTRQFQEFPSRAIGRVLVWNIT